MTLLQYTLIYTVKRIPEPIYRLGLAFKEDQDAWFGCYIPYNEEEEVVAALYDLCKRDLMALMTVRDLQEDDNEDEFLQNITPEIIRNAFKDKSTYYCLTAEGGTLFEKEFKVDWNQYVESKYLFSQDAGSEEVTLTSTSIKSLEVLLEDLLRVNYELSPEKRKSEQIQNWQATYWKHFPIAYSVTCWITRKPDSEISRAKPEILSLKWYDNSIVRSY